MISAAGLQGWSGVPPPFREAYKSSHRQHKIILKLSKAHIHPILFPCLIFSYYCHLMLLHYLFSTVAANDTLYVLFYDIEENTTAHVSAFSHIT